MFHRCQLGTNFSLDFPSQIKVQKHFQRNKPNKDGLVLFICKQIYKLLSQEVKDALQKYNAEAIQKFKSTRNLHETNFLHDLHENTQDNSTTSNQDDPSPDYQESHPDQDLEPPMDDLLDFINSQNHSDDQLDQVLQTYQTYTESQSPTRQVNAHIIYHVTQANQAMHQSFVDRGAYGGLAGSDVRVLNTSSRQCNVIGINNHEIPGLDIVQVLLWLTPIMVLSTLL